MSNDSPSPCPLEPVECAATEVPISPSDGERRTVLDPDIFGRLREMLPPSSLLEVYSAFLADTRKKADLLLVMLEEQSPREDYVRLAHGMRGSAGMIGASAVALLAGDLEVHPESFNREHIVNILSACNDLGSTLREKGLAV